MTVSVGTLSSVLQGVLVLPITAYVVKPKEIIHARTKNHILRESVTFSPSRQPIQWILINGS